jgi:hypothetical protein
MSYKRNGKKWTTPEILRLQREYELLELDINNISLMHKRSPEAIRFKLVNENLVNSLDQIRGYKNVFSSIKEEVAVELSCYRLIKRNSLSSKQPRHTTSLRSSR